ncbi:hypothetical protein TNCV_2377511 [Trichonephila clavipes]|nr:hypothetical protein TNCV_2377511 [Trichonephila clavipes]
MTVRKPTGGSHLQEQELRVKFEVYGRQKHFGVCSKLKAYHLGRSEDENEKNNAVPVSMSSEMRNIMKSMFRYLEAHSNGETNNRTTSKNSLTI